MSSEIQCTNPLRILHIEDNVRDAELIEATLQQEGLEFELIRVQTMEDLKNTLSSSSFDLILADYNLPSFDGITALRVVKEMFPAIPFILVTGTLGEELAVETLKQGATDFVLKDRLTRLSPAVLRAIKESSERQNRKHAEMALKESEEKYRTLVEQVPAIVYIAEPGLQGRCLYVSPRIESILGFTPDEWTMNSQIRWNQIVSEDRDIALSKNVNSEQDPDVSEYRMYKKSGEIIWLRDESVLKQTRTGGTLVHGLMIDITDVKKAEESKLKLEQELLQVQKIEAVGQLAGGVAHDFNNILMVITSYSELLMLQLDSHDPVLKHVQQMRLAAERGSGLTRQLLAFSRKQRLEPRVVNLNEVITGMEGMVRRLVREDIELNIFLDPSVPLVKVDTSQIERLIINLVVNACDAMPSGGKLFIGTANERINGDTGSQQVNIRPGRYAMIKVADKGTGMDQATVTHIFEPFFTTKEDGKGTGLGLSSVYGIVKQSGGNIRVSSEIGKGTTFLIYFPEIQGEMKQAATPEQEVTDLNGKGETILLVDDNDSVREAVGSILSLKGYRVLQAKSGIDAIQMINSKKETIDLLISDVVMPGMNGRNLARRLRETVPGLKVLLMSGYADASSDSELEPSNVVFMSKPVRVDMLLSKARILLNTPQKTS